MMRLVPLTDAHFEDFARLLGGPEFGGCFCAVWTSHDDTWERRCADPSQPNRAITRRLVEAGRHVGYLAYENDRLVGWTGSGAKSHFPFLARKLASRLTPSTPDVWAIGCLAIKAEERGRGVAQRIIEAVIAEARRNGASVLEAFPIRPWDEARSFRGSWTTYERMGFHCAGAEQDGNSEILLMRLGVGAKLGEK